MTPTQLSIIKKMTDFNCPHNEMKTYLATIRVNDYIFYNVTSIIFLFQKSVKFILLYNDRTSGVFDLEKDSLNLVKQRKKV